jgi:hypothetical protein
MGGVPFTHLHPQVVGGVATLCKACRKQMRQGKANLCSKLAFTSDHKPRKLSQEKQKEGGREGLAVEFLTVPVERADGRSHGTAIRRPAAPKPTAKQHGHLFCRLDARASGFRLYLWKERCLRGFGRTGCLQQAGRSTWAPRPVQYSVYSARRRHGAICKAGCPPPTG